MFEYNGVPHPPVVVVRDDQSIKPMRPPDATPSPWLRRHPPTVRSRRRDRARHWSRPDNVVCESMPMTPYGDTSRGRSRRDPPWRGTGYDGALLTYWSKSAQRERPFRIKGAHNVLCDRVVISYPKLTVSMPPDQILTVQMGNDHITAWYGVSRKLR